MSLETEIVSELKSESKAVFRVNVAQLIALVLNVGALFWFGATQNAIQQEHDRRLFVLEDTSKETNKTLMAIMMEQSAQRTTLDNIRDILAQRRK